MSPPHPVAGLGGPSQLTLLRLHPDLRLLAAWAARGGQRALQDDLGYALHGVLRATLGEHAPKPFAIVRPGLHGGGAADPPQLVGYTRAAGADLDRAIELAAHADEVAAAAAGLLDAGAVTRKPMPNDWRSGERLAFEVRVAPVVRTRLQPARGYPEIDVAFHPEFCGAEPGNRDAAHARWLARELGRDGAAVLLEHRAVAFCLTDISRRAARTATSPRAARSAISALLPDLVVRGLLGVNDGAAFGRLLARGLGRHRSFGFGCLLLAPPGAWR